MLDEIYIGPDQEYFLFQWDFEDDTRPIISLVDSLPINLQYCSAPLAECTIETNEATAEFIKEYGNQFQFKVISRSDGVTCVSFDCFYTPNTFYAN